MSLRGSLLALTGDAADAVHMITSALSAYHSTGATVFMPWYLSTLAGPTRNSDSSTMLGAASAKR